MAASKETSTSPLTIAWSTHAGTRAATAMPPATGATSPDPSTVRPDRLPVSGLTEWFAGADECRHHLSPHVLPIRLLPLTHVAALTYRWKCRDGHHLRPSRDCRRA